MTALLIGGFGPDMGGGAARGISLANSGADGITASGEVLACASPSWLACRGDRLIALLEGTGEVAWFSRTAHGWVPDGVVATGGSWPCHAAFLDDDTVAAACYDDGAVVVVRHGEGAPAQRLDGAGSGPLPAQDGPRAHHVHPLPDGRVLTVDLGADRVHVHTRTPEGLLDRVGSVVLPPGTGPRDLRALPSGALALLGEWSCEVLVLSADGDGFRVGEAVALPGATRGADQAAALALSDDGRFLYAGIRGADRIAVLEVEGEGVRAVGSIPTGGSWPRHLVVDGGLLHVANQHSHTVTSFRIGSDGMPTPLGTAEFPSPTCVLPV